MTKDIQFTLNGKRFEVTIDVGMSLTDLVRSLGNKGTKVGCGAGECGACTVLLNGKPVNSCIYLAVWADNKEVLTVEGLSAPDGTLSPLQQAFIDEGAVQCGFCTPGMLLTGTSLVNSGKHYSDEEIKYEMSGNFCRCTGYQGILSALKKVLNSK